MNKSELVDKIVQETGLSKSEAENALNAMLDSIVKAVAKGESVTLIGFGTFKATPRAARTGINPKTGEKLQIAATTVPRFTAGAGFKAALAGKKR